MPAVTSVTNFSDGNVLTATALNAVNCGIHVYSNAAARDAAYGGSGERTLVEGEYAYLLDTDQTLVYSGSSWITVGVTPGLRFITGTTFTSVTSVNLPADTFTATYTNYLIQFYATADGAEALMTSRFRASGSDNTTSNYSYAALGRYSNGNDAGTEGNAVSSFGMRGLFTGLPGSQLLTICEPKTAKKTTVSGMISGNSASALALVTTLAFAGIFNDTTSFDSYSFLASTAITGSYKVYGYSNS